jgi:type II secretory pathway component PulF
MPTFSYKALQPDGKMAEGMLDAGGRPDALRQMEILGLRPVNLVEKAGAAAKAGPGLPAGLENLGNLSFKFQSRKVSATALENFTRLLSSLLASGVPLSRALVILYKEASSPL